MRLFHTAADIVAYHQSRKFLAIDQNNPFTQSLRRLLRIFCKLRVVANRPFVALKSSRLTLGPPEAVEQWSLTSLREKLVNIGAKIVRHGRYVIFQMAEVAMSRGQIGKSDPCWVHANARTPAKAACGYRETRLHAIVHVARKFIWRMSAVLMMPPGTQILPKFPKKQRPRFTGFLEAKCDLSS